MIRVSSVIFPSFNGTLKSHLTSTLLPFTLMSSTDFLFNSALIYELAVLKIYAEPLLFAIDKDCPEYLEAKRLLKFLDYFLPMSPDGIGQNSIIREFIGGSCFNV